MIRTSEDLEDISETVGASSSDAETVRFLPPSNVADIATVEKTAYRLYEDEDRRRWNINVIASVMLGAAAVFIALLSGSVVELLPPEAFVFTSVPVLLSAVCAINSARPRRSERPLVQGDTANLLGMTADEHKGVLAYSYADCFLINRPINDRKMLWLKLSIVLLFVSVVFTVIAFGAVYGYEIRTAVESVIAASL